MTEKIFLMVAGFLGVMGTLLPWVKGPFNDNIAGVTTMQGMLVLVVFFIILGLTLVVKPTNKQVALNFLIIVLSVVVVFITGYTILRVMFDIGSGPALSPIFSIEKGLVLRR